MKWIAFVLLFIPYSNYASDIFAMERKNLALAPANKIICYDMLDKLMVQKNNNKALAYLGAYTMIKANHLFNPIRKLASFNEGKKLLEKSIKVAPDDVELRYIRYAIQISIPKFLGYNDNISDDKNKLQEIMAISELGLQKDIKKILKAQ